jgi:hypothetical protein
MPLDASQLAAIVQLIGDDVRILQPPKESSDGLGGSDVDCVVDRLDPTWPLRLPSEWTLCQVVHYRFYGYNWWLDRNGEVVLLDAIEDPRGLDNGVSTKQLLAEGPAWSTGRALYLTEKRLRKAILERPEWELIGALAQRDPTAYIDALKTVFGRRMGNAVAEVGLAGFAPSMELWRNARRARRLGYLRRPTSGVTVLWLNTARVLKRLRYPTGVFVVLAGPDGSGKSLLADGLVASCGPLFRRVTRRHWRPGLLPPLGTLLRREPGDPTQPHARPPHGKGLSLAVLGYYWLDFFLGGWLVLWQFRSRTGLVVMERGWSDIIVDPRRYRLDVPQRFVRALGRLLLQPDAVFVLAADPQVLFSRKPELTPGELERQNAAWRDVSWNRTRDVWHLDAAREPEELLQEARERIVGHLENKAVSSLNDGWTGFTTRRFRRWALPRGPRAVARSGLRVYQPVTIRGHLGWQAARALASVGGFRVFPRGDAPPKEVREVLGPHVPPRGTVAVAKATHPGRYVALVIGEKGETRALAKVATDDEGREALLREARALRDVAPMLRPPLFAPDVLDHHDSLLLIEAVAWRPRLRPWQLPEEVARGLGLLFDEGSDHGPDGTGFIHGDCAPWNLLRTANGWVLVDWERARPNGAAFYDIFHWFVQAHTLLRRPTHDALVEGLKGRGEVGTLLRCYAEGARIDLSDASDLFDHYLEVSEREIDWELPQAPPARDARRKLLARSR